MNEPLLQVQSEVNGTTHIDIEEIRNFTNGLIYPLYFLDFETIMKQQQKFSKFLYPGTDQSMLKTYFKYTGYDYTHPDIGFEWNHCAGVRTPVNNVCINHYWYNFKPWNIDCPLWLEYVSRSK